MEQRDGLDRFLDDALSECGSASPREGLEQRILANLSARREERRWHWWWVAAPAMAVLALVALFVNLRPEPKHDSGVALASPPAVEPRARPAPEGDTAKQPDAAHPRRKSTRPAVNFRIAEPTAEPRLATFPSPDEGEQQARMLLWFVAGYPEQAREVVREQEQFQQMAEANMNSGDRMESQR
jgi:hypothetical protein